MKSLCFFVGSLVGAGMTCGASAQVVMDFQDLEHIDNLLVDHGYVYSANGYTVSHPNTEPFEFKTAGTLNANFYQGSTMLFNDTVGGVITFEKDDGGTFSMDSIDLAGLFVGGGDTTVTFTASNGSVAAFSTSNGGSGIQTFSFAGLGFDNITSMSWTQDAAPAFHQFDNIAIVPDGDCDADLTGDEVNGEIVGGPGAFVVVPPTATVGAGVEFNVEFVGTPSHSIDIGADSVRIENIFGAAISTGAGEVLVLSDMDGGGPIIGIDNFQTNEGYTIGDVSFTADEIRFEMSPNVWEVDGFVSFDIVFDCDGGCPADLDGDGDADADDFFAYLDAFAAGNLDVCDIDGDGDCDADDFFGYLDLFAQGC